MSFLDDYVVSSVDQEENALEEPKAPPSNEIKANFVHSVNWDNRGDPKDDIQVNFEKDDLNPTPGASELTFNFNENGSDTTVCPPVDLNNARITYIEGGSEMTMIIHDKPETAEAIESGQCNALALPLKGA